MPSSSFGGTGPSSYTPNTSTGGFIPWAAGYSGAASYAGFPQPSPQVAPSLPTAPSAAGLEPAAYEANPYGKLRPKFVGGIAWMGGRIIEGPWFGGTQTDPTLTAIYYLAEAANPGGTRTITKLAIRGAETGFDGSGNLTDAKFAGATVEFKTGTSPQTPCAQSVERYGANAIGYTRGILIAIKNLPLRPLAGIVPLISGKIEDSSFGTPSDGVTYNDLLGVILKDARYSASEYEIDVQRTYAGMILANGSDLITWLQNERKIIVHMGITFTDKIRIVEPTTLSVDAEITNANAVRGSLRFTKTDMTASVRKIASIYIDKDRDYQMNVVTAQEDLLPFPSTSAVQSESVERAVISDAAQETADVHIALYERLAVQSQMQGALLTSMFGIEVGDGARYADHAVINHVGRVLETQHDYGNWQVQFTAAEVLNCGVTFCAEYPLTEPDFVNLLYRPSDFDPLSYIAGGVVLGDYVYAVTNFAVIARVPTSTFAIPQYLDISSSALLDDWIYAHAPFVYDGSVYLTAIKTDTNLSEVLKINSDFSGVTKIGDFGGYNLGSSSFQSRAVVGESVYIAVQFGSEVVRCNLETGADAIYFLSDHPSGLFGDIMGMCADDRYLYMVVEGSGTNYLVRFDTQVFGDAGVSYLAIGSHTGGIPCLADDTIKVVLNGEGGGLLSADTSLNSYSVDTLTDDVFSTIDWWFGCWWDGCRYLYALPEYSFSIASTPDYVLLRIDIQNGNAIEKVSLNSPEDYHPFQIGTDVVFDGDAGDAGSYLYAMSFGHFDDPPHDVLDPASNPYIVIARMPMSS